MKSIAALALVLATTTALAAPPTDAELDACLGKTGTDVPALAAFKHGMTPDEANAAYAGAGKVDKYGFATVKAKGCTGASTLKLFFMKDQGLVSVSIDWDAKLTSNKDFYQRLVTLLAGKYGEVKDPASIDKKLVTWVTSDFSIIQLTTLGPKGTFDLKFSLPKQK